MAGFVAWVRRFLAGEPAVTAWVTGGGLVSLLAFVFHLSRPREAAAAVVIAGAATVWTAVWAHPPEVAAATGGLATVVTAMGVFGFHTPPHLIALAGAVLAVLMAFHTRHALTPWLPGHLAPPAKLRAPHSRPC